MMELPESYMLSKQITKELTGKIISEIVILKTPHKFAFFKNDTSTYADLLMCARLVPVKRNTIRVQAIV